MRKFVPYLAEDAIEREAEALLAEFAHARDVVIKPPIPIEDIMEEAVDLIAESPEVKKWLPMSAPDAVECADVNIGELERDLDALKKLVDAVDNHRIKQARKYRRRVEEATLLTLLLS